jgi:SAM-dependent methyltransferase
VREDDRAAQYDRVFPRVAGNPVLRDLHRQVLGEEYPEGLDVTGACTRTTLRRARDELNLEPGLQLVDLGCGLGGPGRWLARETGARVLGLDISQAAVDIAARSAEGYLKPGQYEYRRGSFSATGLPDEYADAVICIEALAMAEDRVVALTEIRRVLRADGRAMITAGERHGPGEPSFRWEPLIEQAGLTVISRYPDPTKHQRWLAICKLWLDHADELRRSLGDIAEEFLQDARDAPRAWGIPGRIGVHLILERSS